MTISQQQITDLGEVGPDFQTSNMKHDRLVSIIYLRQVGPDLPDARAVVKGHLPLQQLAEDGLLHMQSGGIGWLGNGMRETTA